MFRTCLPYLLIVSLIACCIEVDISAPSFPEMSDYFGVSDGIIQLTIAYNFLGFCLSGLFYGPLSECFGRRRVMIAGNAIMLIGATGCVFAPSIDWLLLSRFIQGLGASTAAVIVFAMIADAYEGSQSVKLIGIMNSVLTILMAIAPIAGGFINKAVGWRGNYMTVAIITLLSWILLFLLLPETKTSREKLDLKKVFKDYGKLFSSQQFLSTALVPSLLCSAYMAFIACGAFLYMETYGLSILTYALHQGCVIASFSVISLFSGSITQRFGAKRCVVLGSIICAVAAFGLVVQGQLLPHTVYLMTSLMSVFCIGLALCYSVIFSASLSIFPEIKGTAASAIMSMRSLCVSLVVAASSYFYDGKPLTVSLVLFASLTAALLLTIRLLKSPLFAETSAETAS
jgi:DHA1 family bicyclomycin/chloramphenicol resistance-like MFS transporter